MGRHLLCSRCSKPLIENFWQMVDEETTQTFSSFRLTCDCGAHVEVEPVRRPRWRRPKTLEFAAATHPQ